MPLTAKLSAWHMVGIWQACVELRGGRAGPQAQFYWRAPRHRQGADHWSAGRRPALQNPKVLLSGVRVVAGETEFPSHLRYGTEVPTLSEDVTRRTNVGCSRVDLSQTTGRTFCQFGLPHSRLSHEGWITGLPFPSNPPLPKPSKKTNTHCLRQYSGLKWGGRMVVRQGQAPTPTVLILQTKHRGSGCNSGLCVRRPFPAWPNPGCLFCLFLEAVALMDSAGR